MSPKRVVRAAYELVVQVEDLERASYVTVTESANSGPNSFPLIQPSQLRMACTLHLRHDFIRVLLVHTRLISLSNSDKCSTMSMMKRCNHLLSRHVGGNATKLAK